MSENLIASSSSLSVGVVPQVLPGLVAVKCFQTILGISPFHFTLSIILNCSQGVLAQWQPRSSSEPEGDQSAWLSVRPSLPHSVPWFQLWSDYRVSLTKAVVFPSELSITKSEKDKWGEDLKSETKIIDHAPDQLLCNKDILYYFCPQDKNSFVIRE